jgi:hypothetical protein
MHSTTIVTSNKLHSDINNMLHSDLNSRLGNDNSNKSCSIFDHRTHIMGTPVNPPGASKRILTIVTSKNPIEVSRHSNGDIPVAVTSNNLIASQPSNKHITMIHTGHKATGVIRTKNKATTRMMHTSKNIGVMETSKATRTIHTSKSTEMMETSRATVTTQTSKITKTMQASKIMTNSAEDLSQALQQQDDDQTQDQDTQDRGYSFAFRWGN